MESLHHSRVLAKIFNVPALSKVPAGLLSSRILDPMRLAGGGTLETCRAALKHGLAINIGGGYHHADRTSGGGFCVYSDIPIALSVLRKEGLLKRALVVDTDAHQGNGFANVLRDEPNSFVLDFFDESIYPFPKVQEHQSVAFPARTGGAEYLSKLESWVPKVIAEFKPELIVHNAGSDVLNSDPLSSFRLSVEDMNQRDLAVVNFGRKENIPVAMVLAGGYGKESAHAHTRSIQKILEVYDRDKKT